MFFFFWIDMIIKVEQGQIIQKVLELFESEKKVMF